MEIWLNPHNRFHRLLVRCKAFFGFLGPGPHDTFAGPIMAWKLAGIVASNRDMPKYWRYRFW